MGKLLIVDDDSATREMMGGFFTEKGILCFLREMGRKPSSFFRPSLPVILITGRSLREGGDNSFLDYLYGYFPKPVDLKLLEVSIAKVLGNGCFQ